MDDNEADLIDCCVLVLFRTIFGCSNSVAQGAAQRDLVPVGSGPSGRPPVHGTARLGAIGARR